MESETKKKDMQEMMKRGKATAREMRAKGMRGLIVKYL